MLLTPSGGFVKYCLIVLVLILFSCSDSNKSANTAAENSQPLIFLHYWSEEMGGGIEDMVSVFNQNNPGYKVKQTGFDHESFKVSMRVMLKGGNPPDIFSYWAGARTESLIKQGYLVSIKELWEDAGLDTLFSATVRDACFYEDNPYMVPVTQHYVSFYYNKKMFKKYGLEPPKTWKQFHELCAKLKEQGETPLALGAQNLWPAQFWFDYLLLRTAGPEYRRKLMKGKASYEDPEVKKVFALWKELLDKEYFSEKPLESDWSDAGAMVGKGEAAMTLMGTWLIGYLDHSLKLKQGVEYGQFAFPVVTEGVSKVALGPIDGILLPKSGHEKKALKVLAIFTKEEVQEAMSLGSGSLSPAKTVLPKSEKLVQREIHKELQGMDSWAFNYDLATPPPAASKGLELFGKFISEPTQTEMLLTEMEKHCRSLDEKVW